MKKRMKKRKRKKKKKKEKERERVKVDNTFYLSQKYPGFFFSNSDTFLQLSRRE